METVLISELSINNKLQFIDKNKNFFEGTIRAVYSDCFAVHISTLQPNYELINSSSSPEFLIAFEAEAYRCCAKVLGSKVSDNFQILMLGKPQVIVRIERRQYVRLQSIMEINYCFIPNDEKYSSIKDVPLNCFRRMRKSFTIDISGGGVKIITYEKDAACKQVLISLFINEEIKVLCSLVRSEYDDIKKIYRTALKFEDIDQTQRMIIIKFIEEKLKNQPSKLS